VDEFIANRQDYCRSFDAAFEPLVQAGHVTVFDTDWKDVAPYIYVLRVSDRHVRGELIEHLDQLGIATGIHFLGAHRFSFYAAARRGPLPVTDRVCDQVLTLPLHPYMHAETLQRIADGVTSFFHRGR
jgi:dTDP-4-amino-4,6-dideoxygalactose transaminase